MAHRQRRTPGGNRPQPAPAAQPNAVARPGHSRRRIALYSHDTMGLGHTRRNLLIAQALHAAGTPADILLITGANEANAFAMPPGVDVLSLPAIRKGSDGNYHARRLDLSLGDLRAIRAETIRAALLAFAPDVLIVDNVPRGAARELDPALDALRAPGGPDTRIVLGLRDVLDEPPVVAREWERAGNLAVLRSHYNAIWVYGDRAVYDTARAYRFPRDIAAKVTYTGYLDGRQRHGFSEADSQQALAALDLPAGRLALCMLGGGEDGAQVALAFAEAQMPTDMHGLLVTGPYMPEATQQRLQQIAAANPRLRVVEFLPEPTLLLHQAERVIAMAGYNTTTELLAFEKPALLIPRVKPRREQWLRAERLHQMGLASVLHPDVVSPAALSAWLARPLPPSTGARERLDLNGVKRLPGLLDALLTPPAPAIAASAAALHTAPMPARLEGSLAHVRDHVNASASVRARVHVA